MVKITSERLKQIQLSILDDIHSFCMENDLRYSLTGGSLIGSVRHGGYIPWDDDIDIMMPRPDYERFLAEYHSPKNAINNLIKSELCVETFAKIERIGTIMTDNELGRSIWGINVDVFPIDGMPGENTRAYFDELSKMNSRLGVYCPFYKSVTTHKVLWAMKYWAKRLLYFNPHSYLYLKEKLNRQLLSTQFETSPYAALFCGGDGWCEIMPRSVFETFEDVPFEGYIFRRIKEYDQYLHSVFGDYMQLPPENERISKHNYSYYQIH